MKHIIEGYEITDYDDNNYVVTKEQIIKEGKNAGKTTTVVLGYFSSLPAAVRYVARRVANGSEDLRGWLSAFTSVLDGFTKIVEDYR